MKEGVERLDPTNSIPTRSHLLYSALRPFESASTKTAICNAILNMQKTIYSIQKPHG